MDALSVIAFKLGTVGDEPGGPTTITPEVDGVSLIERVHRFEADRSYEPSGGYAGLIPAHFRFGDLTEYYLGVEPRQWPRPEHAWLLGCDCGEVGCWPLTAHITLTESTVAWSHFQQPHRPSWNYDDFGPFLFDRQSYYAAVVEAARDS
jgi:hypothetical protein